MFKINDRVWVLPFEEIAEKSEEGDGRHFHYLDATICFNLTMKDHCGGEYRIHTVLSDGSYTLKTPTGEPINWTWCDWMLTGENPRVDYSDDSEEDDFWDEPYETETEIAPVRESYVLVHNSEFKGILDLTEAEAEAIVTVICAIDTDTDILTIAQAKEEFRL